MADMTDFCKCKLLESPLHSGSEMLQLKARVESREKGKAQLAQARKAEAKQAYRDFAIDDSRVSV